MPRDYYAVLGLPQGSSLVNIRVAYRNLAARYHPDKFSAASAEEQAAANLRMVELNEAMSVLGNVGRRSEYDRELKAATLTAALTRRRVTRTSAPLPQRPEAAPRAAESTQTTPTRADIEKRVAALRKRILAVPLQWKNLTLPAWAWGFESNGDGRPLLIAHQHCDLLESKDIRALDKAIDRILAGRTEKLRSPWVVMLLSCNRLLDSTKLLSALDGVVKRGRGWLKKRPMIVLYDEGSGRVIKFGQMPEHDHMEQILNLLLHP